jgi:hypothetical protein
VSLGRILAVLACVAGAAVALSAPAGAPAAAPRAMTGFLSTPTDQVGVPGLIAGAEITPQGDLYTGWGEYELRFGRRLAAWDQPTRTLPDPSLPLLSSALSDGPIRYTQTVFAIAVGGRPVAYDTVTVTNRSNRVGEARVAMALAYTRGRRMRGVHGLMTTAYRYERPAQGGRDGSYEQPGQPFSPAFRYGFVGRDLVRSGLLLARGPAIRSRALRGPAIRSRALRGPPGNSQTTPHDARLFTLALRPGASVSLTWQIPLEPGAPTTAADKSLDRVPLTRARADLARAWAAEEAPMMRISVPEARVLDAYRAALTAILLARYETPSGWVQGVNKLQYQAFWIRDGALETQALDLAGLHSQAAQNLAFMDTYQQPSGLFISRRGQYDGLGQALWALAEHALLTQDPGYAAAQLARLNAAIEWLSAATAADPLRLLPAANPHDGEFAYGHLTGDNLWAAAGLRSAIADAVLAGREDLASAWRLVDEAFEASLDRAVAAAVARAGHIPPVLDAADGWDWGNYGAAYPVQVLPVSSPAVQATLAWEREHMAEGLPTYADGRSLHDYLGFSLFQSELAAGDTADAVAGLYSELAHTTSTDGGWEWDVTPFGSRSSRVDMSPHGTFAADYIALLRNLLVEETPTGGVSLLAGASPAWLGPGQHVTVTGAPTEHGVISFTERSSARGETLAWRGDLAPGTALTWRLPAWALGARTVDGPVGGSVVVLHGASGSVTVAFDGTRPRQSYQEAVAALNAVYRAHGRRAPIVPAVE